jgi:hypothetical protein
MELDFTSFLYGMAAGQIIGGAIAIVVGRLVSK